jgi:hypothetical protein
MQSRTRAIFLVRRDFSSRRKKSGTLPEVRLSLLHPSTTEDAMMHPKSSRKFRKLTGLFAGLALVAGAAAAVIPAYADPGPSAPVARLLNVKSTEAARAAYIEAMRQQGYEILPPTQAYSEPTAGQ